MTPNTENVSNSSTPAPTDTMQYTFWNPLDARSPLRSQRVQGSVAVLVGLIGQVFEIPYLDEGKVTELFATIGTLLIGIGSIRAKSSARSF